MIQKEGHCLPSAEYGQSADGIGVDLPRRIRSLRSNLWLLVLMAVHMHRYYVTSFGLQTHY